MCLGGTSRAPGIPPEGGNYTDWFFRDLCVLCDLRGRCRRPSHKGGARDDNHRLADAMTDDSGQVARLTLQCCPYGKATARPESTRPRSAPGSPSTVPAGPAPPSPTDRTESARSPAPAAPYCVESLQPSSPRQPSLQLRGRGVATLQRGSVRGFCRRITTLNELTAWPRESKSAVGWNPQAQHACRCPHHARTHRS